MKRIVTESSGLNRTLKLGSKKFIEGAPPEIEGPGQLPIAIPVDDVLFI